MSNQIKSERTSFYIEDVNLCLDSQTECKNFRKTSQTLCTFIHSIIKMHVPIATEKRLYIGEYYIDGTDDIHPCSIQSLKYIRCVSTGPARISDHFLFLNRVFCHSKNLFGRLCTWRQHNCRLHFVLLLSFHQDHHVSICILSHND